MANSRQLQDNTISSLVQHHVVPQTYRYNTKKKLVDDEDYSCKYFPHSDPEFSDEEQAVPFKVRLFCRHHKRRDTKKTLYHFCEARMECWVKQWTLGYGVLRKRYGFPRSPKYETARKTRCLGRHLVLPERCDGIHSIINNNSATSIRIGDSSESSADEE